MSWLLVSNVLIGFFPMQFYGLKKYEISSHKISIAVCNIWRYSYFTFTHINLVSLLLMTTDKVVTLRYSLSYNLTITGHRINCIYTIFWLFFIIFDAVLFLPISATDDEWCYYAVMKFWALTMNILTMIIPYPIIVVSYIYMLVVACQQMQDVSRQGFIKSKWNNKMNKICNKNALELKATKQVLHIVGTYVLCWLPSRWYYLLTWLCPKYLSNEYKPHRPWIRFFFKLLVMFHAFITPLLFCWSSDVFRREALRLVLKIGCDRERNPNEDKTKLSKFSVARLQISIRIYVKAKHNMSSNTECFV